MKFIKLAGHIGEELLYLNPRFISTIFKGNNIFTEVVMGLYGISYHVKETPEEILKMIKESE
jgi:hypothetical protein